MTSELIVAYGGGVNSVAMLVQLVRSGVRPRAIVMSDPGSEWPETTAYRDDVARPWLRERGYPDITVVSRITEAAYRPRARSTEQTTLLGECRRIRSLPSIAYGWKKCSIKYKALPSQWWVERQPWAREAWARGERVTKAIGYDADEGYRVRKVFLDPLEARRFVPWYPLVEAGVDREGCEALIVGAGLPLPHKSACTFCPSNTLEEWRELRDVHPDLYAEAVELSSNAELTSPDVVGLMRCLPHGRRQLHLHVWNESEKGRLPDDLPCECAL